MGALVAKVLKGLISLFTSGIIFNPMVLLGIGLGIFVEISWEAERIYALLKNYHLYLLIWRVSGAYVFVFKRSYKDGGVDPDYAAMIFASITGVLKFVMAFVLAMSFIMMISF